MRTFLTILLIAALSTPGIALADPGERSTASLWQDLLGWVAESLGVVFDAAENSGGGDGLPEMGGTIDPLGSTSGMSGGFDPAGAASETRLPGMDGTSNPYGLNGDSDEDEPSVPNMGGTIDPLG